MDNRLKAIHDAKNRVEKIIRKTPLLYSYFLSDEVNANIYLKAENLQRTGAFKLRGAYNMISQLDQKSKDRGLIASSAGNHAQGVSLASKELGVQATIVMPSTTPLIKVEATKQYGANVILHGEMYDDAYKKACELKEENDLTFVHPFADIDIINGQGTIGLEILEQLEDVDTVIVPIGGGGLISGISMAIKMTNPNVEVIGVEPVGAQTLKKSIEAGKVIPLEVVSTIAEGVAVRQAGQLDFDIINEFVDKIVTVDDFDIMEAFLILAEREKLVAENAGVLSVAALKKLDLKDKNVVCLISGGNIDVVTISELISRGLVVRGRIFGFAVELNDIPGQLETIATTLAELGANIIQLDHNQFKTVDRFKRVRLEVTCETNGKEHVEKIKKALEEKGYKLEITV